MKKRKSFRRPEHHVHVPGAYALTFSASDTPVLTVRPGDTVESSSIDSSGFDRLGMYSGFRYNALTGPFAVEGARPGDALVVDLMDIRIDRGDGLAWSGISERATTPGEYARSVPRAKLYNWRLDPRTLTGTPRLTRRLARLRLPLRPFPGCVGVAPDNGEAVSSLYAGRFGGNIDCNQLVAGIRLYFPVSVPGALFYFGDGHAAQGDGESCGGAIETCLAVKFRLDVIRRRPMPCFRAESSTHCLAFGVGQPLDEAYQRATANMIDWLVGDFGLDPHEAYVLIGVASEIGVANVVNGRGNTMVCRLAKSVLAQVSGRHRRPPR